MNSSVNTCTFGFFISSFQNSLLCFEKNLRVICKTDKCNLGNDCRKNLYFLYIFILPIISFGTKLMC